MPGTVLVVIYHEFSGFNKKWTKEDFPGVGIESIKDLTYFEKDISELQYLNGEAFCQILSLTLENDSKEYLIESILKLEQLPFVKYAEPSYVAEVVDYVDVTVGDVDGDGYVTSTDARLVLQLAVGKICAEDINAAAGEIDGDDVITSTDARILLQMAVHPAKWPA